MIYLLIKLEFDPVEENKPYSPQSYVDGGFSYLDRSFFFHDDKVIEQLIDVKAMYW